jgi:pyridoxamine 5'-phosphate oxidase
MIQSIADIRKDYQLQSLTENDVAPNPLDQFRHWWDDALRSKIEEVNAMTLATSSSDGIPSARILLLKGISEKGFIFFTNYNSYKGQQLAENPRACLVFFWKEIERQVRITGIAEKLGNEENDIYFNSRPEKSRIGAWASPQSQVIESREWLDEQNKSYESKFNSNPLARPTHWGGYIVKPVTIEFWQGRPSRLHDRLQYSLTESGEWKVDRLAP